MFSKEKKASDESGGGSKKGDTQHDEAGIVFFQKKGFAEEFESHGRLAADVLQRVRDVVEQVEFSSVGFVEVLAGERFRGGATGDDPHI